MRNDVPEVVEPLQYSCAIQVHCLMCMELMKFIHRISQIFPAIELARPQCVSGIQALCSLNRAMDNAKLLLQYCAECSKLYLAITGDAIVLRFERVRKALYLSLSQIENMVPLQLAAQISGIIDDLRAAKFILQSSEEETGKAILALLRQGISVSDSIENSELKAFQLAALKLHITSPKAVLIERRSVKKLLNIVRGTPKEHLLKYLLYLLKKYGKSIGREHTENTCAQHEGTLSSTNSAFNNCGESIEPEPHARYGWDEAQTDMSNTTIPPEEFRCPISLRLMHDPVIIASGQTFERVWIEKWFNEGNDTCPKTANKLSHLSMTQNSAMKDLIAKWCRNHGITVPDPCSQPRLTALNSWKTSSSSSIASFGSSLNDLCLHIDVSNVSLGSSVTSYCLDSSHVNIINGSSLVSPLMSGDSHRCQSSTNSQWVNFGILSELAALPWGSQSKAVEDVRNHLRVNNQACHSMLSNSFLEPLIRFLKDALDLCDVKAQRAGAQVLLAFVSKSRNEIQFLCDDAFYLLASFLDSEITEEALAIIEVLSGHQYCKSKIVASGALPSILKVLDTQISELHAPAIRILYNLSSNSDVGSHIVYLECIPMLIPFLGNSSLSVYCMNIFKNLSNTEEARDAIAESNECIASIAELLETGNHEEQEHAVAVLLSICSQWVGYCHMVLKEGVIPSLVSISNNGNTIGKAYATDLLHLLRDIRHSDVLECPPSHDGSNFEISQDSGNKLKEKKLSSRAFGYFRKKMSVLSNPVVT
ncbi:hypothetical protein HHK36_002495 [Tetracentron sinense]|uniref:RING-type E3 ubiquitin transferase n=1 Tax=Tetracentron sinense TaxID=13715 RepID=A0A834ZQU5_TETSI|nr:hypothetical protein HHK36_002495 [Tetracentron sinense]